MKDTDRRTFLKLGLAVIAGAFTGGITPFLGDEIDSAVEESTGHPTGNAGIRQQIEQACQASPDPQKCVQNYEFSTPDKVRGIVVAPIEEEMLFRALPSVVLSLAEEKENPVGDVLIGTDGLGMTKRELVVGVASSLVFGALHNVTAKGIDTKTIPASQTAAGMILWYLQRKLGIAANTLAHGWNNFVSI